MARDSSRAPAKAGPAWRAPLVFAAAVLLRGVFVGEWIKTPYFSSPLADARVHEAWALEILAGRLVRSKAFYQSPFYPYLLALIYRLFGHHPLVMIWLQVVVGALTCVLIQRIAERCFDQKAGVVAGLLAAFYGPFIFMNALLLKETWVVAGLGLACLAALAAEREGRPRDAFLCGLALGWTAISRGNVLLLIPAMLAWWAWRSRERLLRLGPVCVLGGLLPILPATLHNYAASRDFVPMVYAEGFAFFIGNNKEATGAVFNPLGISSDPVQEELQTTRIAEAALGRSLRPSEVSRYWFRRGLGFIRDDPARWLALTARKFWLFWSWFEPPDNYCLLFVKEHFSSLLQWPLPSFAWVATLGALGLFLTLGEAGGPRLLAYWIAVYILSTLPFLISNRYRLPATVFLIPFSAAAIERLAHSVSTADWRPIGRPGLAAVPIIILVWLPSPLTDPDMRQIEAIGWSQLASIYHRTGRDDESAGALDRAFAANPGSITEPGLDDGAAAQEQSGNPLKAIELYELGVRMFPRSARLRHNLGATLFRQSQRDHDRGLQERAIGAIKEAIGLDPDYALAYKNLFRIYSNLGDKESALKYGKRALELDPDDAELRRQLGG